MDGAKDTWRECISVPIVSGLHEGAKRETTAKNRKAPGGRKDKSRRNESASTADAGELYEFIEYIADEMYDSLPPDLTGLTYYTIRENAELDAKYSLPLTRGVLEELASNVPHEVVEAMTSCELLNETHELEDFLRDPLNGFIEEVTKAPSSSVHTVKAKECEICDRDWIPLTYHHLIPKGVHAKVLKRGWHAEERLNDVAWLCRACHSMVHRIASHEELARDYYSVELLLEREDVQRFATWISRVRWKSR